MRNRRRVGAVLVAAPVLLLVAMLSIPLLAAGVGDGGSPPAAGCTPGSASGSILGPSSMSVADLTAWWASTGRGQPPSLSAEIDDVIALYVRIGEAEGVRGDMALAQAILETGHFTSADTARNNFAGIGHADGEPAGLPFPDVATGVRAHVQLLRKYAAGNDTPLAGPDVAPDAGASAPTWDDLATRWASSPDYGTRLADVYESMRAAASASAGSASAGHSTPSPSASASAPASTDPPCDPAADVVNGPDDAGVPLRTVRGITVHASLAGQLESLLAAAESDGVHLTGWGYRSHERQIELRRENCGPSQYETYQMPSSRCSPPTARPGSSQHEQGLAVDFEDCSARTSACYRWLADNARTYGLYNLPSEPWHWSVDGT